MNGIRKFTDVEENDNLINFVAITITIYKHYVNIVIVAHNAYILDQPLPIS